MKSVGVSRGTPAKDARTVVALGIKMAAFAQTLALPEARAVRVLSARLRHCLSGAKR